MRAIAQERDREAFRRLFERYAPRVKGFFARSGHASQLAEDLAQDVMLSVWRGAGGYCAERSAVSTWIFTITRNRNIDHHRRRRLPVADAQDPCYVASPEPAQDHELAARRRSERVRRALSSLPREQADLVHAATFKQLTMAEIAEESQLPLGTVKSRLRRAMARLRCRVEGDTVGGGEGA